MTKEVMKQEQDDPVAYVHGDDLDNMLGDRLAFIQRDKSGHRATPLYTTPQTKEWVGLTEYEIKGVLGLSESWVGEDCSIPDMIGFSRAIEAKLKEKNHVVSGQ